MRLFRVPYRWLPRTFITNVRWILEDLFWIGPKNVIRWLPHIWLDDDFDSCYTLDIMAWKFGLLADCLENGHHFNGKREAKKVRTVALLCDRISNDDVYYRQADKRFPDRGLFWSRHINSLQKQDKEMLGKLIGKYIDHWWD